MIKKKNACCIKLVAYLTATNKLPETEITDKITKKYPQSTDISTQSKVIFKLLLVTTPLRHQSNKEDILQNTTTPITLYLTS